METIWLEDDSATLAAGAAFAQQLKPGHVVYLQGELGAGKTTFARGILRGLGFLGKVKSPSYTLVEVYAISSLYLYHFDLYRFVNPTEWEEAGCREYFNSASVCLIEWPEKAQDLLPPPDMRFNLAAEGAGRTLIISAHSERGKQCLAKMCCH